MAISALAADPTRSAQPRGRGPTIAAVAGLAISAVVVAQAANQAGRVLLHNASPSEPEGVYLRTFDAPAVGRLVTFRTPALGSLYASAHMAYLSARPILKALAAGPGDLVCTTTGRLVIDGQVEAPIAMTDRHGVALPHWNGCRRLRAGEWFAYSNRIPNSFDSRYYGPIRTAEIIAVYRPLWVGSETGR